MISNNARTSENITNKEDITTYYLTTTSQFQLILEEEIKPKSFNVFSNKST